MFDKNLVRSTYKIATQKYFEEKYESQFQSILEAARNREKFVVFSLNQCPIELAIYLMCDLNFSLYKWQKDRWVAIFEAEEAKDYERIMVKW